MNDTLTPEMIEDIRRCFDLNNFADYMGIGPFADKLQDTPSVLTKEEAFAYVIHESLFKPWQVIIIFEERHDRAVFDIQMIHDLMVHLPEYLKDPIVRNLRDTIQFENGSKIHASSSKMVMKGRSVSNLIIGDGLSNEKREVIELEARIVQAHTNTKVIYLK